MQNAIACNVSAISKMESRDFEGAFNLLRTSMMSLTNDHHHHHAIQRAQQDKLPFLADPSPSMNEDGGEIILGTSSYDQNIDRFFTGSFLFTLAASATSIGAAPRGHRYSARQIDYCSVVCLYNMGLACHLEYENCTDDCSKREKLLHQARVLYLTAYQLLQKYPVDPTDSVILLVMVLSANLIDIQLELGGVDEVKFWRNILEDASSAADALLFVGRPVYVFFDSIYIAPGDLIAARAA